MSWELTPDQVASVVASERIAFAFLAPPLDILISEYADRHREMPKGTSSQPGKWVTYSYQREIMDCILDPNVRDVVCSKSTQLGLTEVLNNIIAYFIVVDPKTIMMVRPSLDDAKDHSKKRLIPMIEANDDLKSRIRIATSRKPGNTMILKEFQGGFVKLTGANSGKGLRSDAIEILLMDEVDGYPDDVDGEGPPCDIAERRTDTFRRAKRIKVSTPAKPKGLSVIENAYLDSSRGRFHVRCPHCHAQQVLKWRDKATGIFHLHYLKDERGRVDPKSVGYLCAGCGALIEERQKYAMIQAGEWIHEDQTNRVRGFHLNALYVLSNDNWLDLCEEWVKAQGDSLKLKAFVNLRLGETFEEESTSIEPEGLASRLKPFARAVVPAGVAVLVCAVDVQKNRLEAQIVGYGDGEESWLVDWAIHQGDPGLPDVWNDLDAWLLEDRFHESGKIVPLGITVVDSGWGEQADPVYDFVVPRQNPQRMVFAIKGVDYIDQQGLAKHGTAKNARVKLWQIATISAKKRILSRLQLQVSGPGFIHLPDWVSTEYLEQLTSEKLSYPIDRKTHKAKETWIKIRNRNEALDMTVYCLGGLFILQNFLYRRKYADLAALAAELAGVPPVETPQPEAPEGPKPLEAIVQPRFPMPPRAPKLRGVW